MPEPAEPRVIRPEDVPDDLAAMLERALYSMPSTELTGRIARVALAAVLPEHARQVRADERAKIATECQSRATEYRRDALQQVSVGRTRCVAKAAELEALARWLTRGEA